MRRLHTLSSPCAARRALALLSCVFVAACAGTPAPNDAGLDAGSDAGADGGWVELFNGTDLTGWHSWLGKRSSDPGANEPVIGLDDDPDDVFSVAMVDGEPAIHITGQTFGALISEQDYGDFELELQYRWGTRVWPPLNFFDSGIMYLSTGPYGAVNAGGPALVDPIGTGGFLVSMEYQIAMGSVGTAPNLGPISFSVVQSAQSTEQAAWNDVRIVLENGTARHFLNGTLVTRLSGFTLDWPGQASAPLTRGRLQLQSENGEIYFRHLRLRP